MSKLYYVVYKHKDDINWTLKTEEEMADFGKSVISSTPCRYIDMGHNVTCDRGRMEGSTACLNCKYSRLGLNPDHPLCLFPEDERDY